MYSKTSVSGYLYEEVDGRKTSLTVMPSPSVVVVVVVVIKSSSTGGKRIREFHYSGVKVYPSCIDASWYVSRSDCWEGKGGTRPEYSSHDGLHG